MLSFSLKVTIETPALNAPIYYSQFYLYILAYLSDKDFSGISLINPEKKLISTLKTIFKEAESES